MVAKFKHKEIGKIEVLLSNQEYHKALEQVEKLLKKSPTNPLYLNIKGFIFIRNKKFNEAIPFFIGAIRNDEKFIEAIINLAICYFNLNDIDKGVELFKRVLTLDPNNYTALYNLAGLNMRSSYFQDALPYYLKLHEIDPKNDDWIEAITRIFVHLNDVSKAVFFHKKTNKKNDSYYNYLGVLNSYSNDMSSAKINFKKASQLILGNLTSLYSLFNLVDKTDHKLSNEESTFLKKMIDSGLNSVDKAFANFALAQDYDHKGEYDHAIKHFHFANRNLVDKNPFDANHNQRLQDNLFKLYDMLKTASFNLNSNDKKIIFIVGMPRSGSTMLERILAQDSRVHPVGETSILTFLLCDLSMFNDSKNLERNVNLFRTAFFDKISQFSDKKIIVDKSLLNWRFLGIIELIFPEVKIINLVRNPIANCFSCYKAPFNMKKGTLNFAASLEDLAYYYNHYLDVIKTWQDKKISNFKTFSYEDLTNEPERNIPKVFDFVGLEFKKDYLNIQKSNYIVKTASLKQATKSIYKGSSEEWRRYEKFLEPLTSKLKF